MSLHDDIISDLAEIMHDTDGGAMSCIITPPSGEPESFSVFYADIHLSEDPVSGAPISGRQSSVAVLIADLESAGFAAIRGIARESESVWTVEVSDAQGNGGLFSVCESHPDSGIGLMVLYLETYEA